MSVYREKKFHLWALLSVLSLLLVWQPWHGLLPAVRGVPAGIETSGGYGVLLEYQSSIVDFRVEAIDFDAAWDSVVDVLSPYWSARLISSEPSENLIRFEVGGQVTTTYLQTLLGTIGTVENVVTGVSQLDEQTARSLKHRLDPHGLAGTSIRLSQNSIWIETQKDPELIQDTLTKQGRLELFVEKQRAIGPEDILAIGRASESGTLGVIPIYFTEEGEADFNNAVLGKGGSRLTAYLDRPFDAVILFDNVLLPEFLNLLYDNIENIFKVKDTLEPIMVTAFPTDPNELSPEIVQYLNVHAGEKLRVILLGTEDDFSTEFLEAIPQPYVYEFFEKRPGEEADDWVIRACGVLSTFLISDELAENGLAPGGGINVPVVGGYQAAKTYRTIIAYPLPVRVSEITVATLESTVSTSFVDMVFFGSALGLILSSALVSRWYRRGDFGLALLISGGSVLLLVLATVAVLKITLTANSALLVSGIFYVCLVQLLFVTRELLAGIKGEEKVKIGWRIPKAIATIYLSSLAVGALLIALSAMKIELVLGGAAVFIVAAMLNSFLVAPIHGRILETLVSRGIEKQEQAQV